MEEDEPNFEALAELWLARDPRIEKMSAEDRAKTIARLAQALRKRRERTTESEQEEHGLVVHIDRDHISPDSGLSERAIEQLEGFLRERISQEIEEKSDDS